MKETYYFPHDYEPTSDPKIQALIGEHGATGYGIFWRVIEMLHSDSTHKLPLKDFLYIAIAKQMQVEVSIVEALLKQCLSKYELLQTDASNMFWSDRVNRNIEERENQRQKRAKAGKLGGTKTQQKKRENRLLERNQKSVVGGDANTSHNSSIAKAPLKQNEAKERKGKESIITINKSPTEIVALQQTFGNEEINKLLAFIKKELSLTGFKESVKQSRMWGHNLVVLAGQIGKSEFVQRFKDLAGQEFYRKNMGSLQFIYKNIKGFVENNNASGIIKSLTKQEYGALQKQAIY